MLVHGLLIVVELGHRYCMTEIDPRLVEKEDRRRARMRKIKRGKLMERRDIPIVADVVVVCDREEKERRLEEGDFVEQASLEVVE